MNTSEIQDIFNSELMTNSIPVQISSNNNNINNDFSKNYKEDIINPNQDMLINSNKETVKQSFTDKNSSSKIYDLNSKIFSDDDMSLNKSKEIKKNNSKNINMDNNISSTSLLLSLNINEIQLDESNNDIKKIIPIEIYNNIRNSGNKLLINDTKEGLKKLFIFLSDSLNNQKKITGSNNYYYNNDLNSDNLLKIYIYVFNILNKNENNDIINEILFTINLILPLLPTMYINNICIQLIEKFFNKTADDDLNKNINLLFKQILKLNVDIFFDKIFNFLKNQKSNKIKLFWKNFFYDLIKKNNENSEINLYFDNNDNVINLLNEYHKDNLIEFCLGLFSYDDLNEITSNKDAIELIKCIKDNKILNNQNNKEIISFKDMILDKAKEKENENLNLIIKNIFKDNINNNSNNNNSEINNNNNKNIGNKNINSGYLFLGSFGTFNKNNNNFNDSEKNFNENEATKSNNNYNENKEKYENNEIFEVMDNNIIYDNKENDKNLLEEKKPTKENNKKEKIYNIDLSEDDLYSDREDIEEENNNNNNNNNEKYGGGDSLINYKYSISNKDIIMNNKKKEKKSIIKESNNTNNASKRTSKISEFYEYFNKSKRTTLNNINNNNLVTSFSSFSSVKRNSNDISNENDDNINNNEKINIINNNNNFLNISKKNNINNIKENDEKKENKEFNINNNIINNNLNNEIIEEKNNMNNNNNIINNDNFLDIIKNNKSNNKNKTKNIKIISEKYINKEGFDYEKCLLIIDKEKWSEKQEMIQLLKKELEKNLNQENYNKNEIPLDAIVNLINKKLNDKQQKLVILILEVLEIIINKLNDIFNEEFLPLLSKNIINNLNDNNIQLRYKAATVILKILKLNKREFFIYELIDSLKIDKNNMRIEILTILTQFFPKNSSSKKANKNFFESLIEPLVLCIEDKFNKIRNLSEELIKESSKYITINKYFEATKKLYNKVVEDKVNIKIKEIFGIENNNDFKQSIKSIKSIIENDDLKMNKKNKDIFEKKKNERSKSADIDNNKIYNNDNVNKKKYLKKNANKNKNFKDKNDDENQNINNNNKNLNNYINNNEINFNQNSDAINKEFDYKNVFKKSQNFLELKKYRANKDIKLCKNFVSIKEKGKNINSESLSDIKPLSQIFLSDFINKCIIPCNNNLIYILQHVDNILINCDNKNYISNFLPNLDIVLEYIIRLFNFNFSKNYDFITEYISFMNNLNEIILKNNSKISNIEYNIIFQSLIYLSKYNNNSIQCLKKFYRIISIDKIFRILFEYNDVNDIETHKKIIELFIDEIKQGKIDIHNDDFYFIKKVIKFLSKEELNILGKNFFKEINNILGKNIFKELINKLNKHDKNILLNNIKEFYIIEEESKQERKIKKIKIDLNDMKSYENSNNINKKNIKELMAELNSSNDYYNLESINENDDINNSNIILNKLNIISLLSSKFNEINYENNKNIFIKNIEYILDSLSQELNFFFNINTMNDFCSKNVIKYIQNLISIFFIISSKEDLIINLKEDILNKLIILFLNYLLIDKEENISDLNNTFNTLFQKINKITLNLIQNSNRENIIIILIKLISNFKDESDISLLAIKCFIKLIKITKFKKIDSVNILSEIIIAIDDEDLFNENNNIKTKELFIKSIKKLLNILVLEKKHEILKEYQIAINKCNIKDSKVYDWINKIMEHHNL